MTGSVEKNGPQLHPLQRALKVSWRKLVVNREIKQLFLAMRCHVDESRVSRWLNPDMPDFPPTSQMALLLEAMQEWPEVEKWEPLEAFNTYFGCHVATLQNSHRSLQELAALMALKSGQALNLFIQALAPDSEGGVDLGPGEAESLRPVVATLRRLADDLDDELNGAEEKKAVGE